MRHLFIINPAAGKKNSTAALEKQIAALSFDHNIAYTLAEGDARRITEEAVSLGEPMRIYACGGDGTLNEVVNGAAGHDHVAITNVPKGTGNDFLKLFGPDYRRLFYDLEALAVGPQTAMDLMDCNGKLGIDVACAGVDARIAAGVHKYKSWHLVSGIGAYILSMIDVVCTQGLCRPMKVQMEDLELDGEVAALCVCNGRHYGGGFMPVPEAMPDDGVLDMLLVPKVSLGTFLRLVGDYAKGEYRKYPDLILARHGQRLTYSSPKGVIAVVDGEVMHDTSFTVRLSEKKVNFFYPAGAGWSLPGTEQPQNAREGAAV